MKSAEVLLVGLVEGRIGVQVRGEEVFDDGGIIRAGVLCAMLR